MFKLFLLFVLMSVGVLPLGAESSAWKELQTKFEGVEAFSVRFLQEPQEEMELFQKPPPARGKIRVERKPKFQLWWTYEFPNFKEISYDGTAWFLKEEGRVESLSLSEDQLKLSESFSFLWGATHPALKLLPVDAKRFKIVAKEAQQAGFQEILVRVEKGLVQEAEVLDLLDGKSRYEFSDWKL